MNFDEFLFSHQGNIDDEYILMIVVIVIQSLEEMNRYLYYRHKNEKR